MAREIGAATAAITRNSGFSRHAMQAASALRILGNHGTGVDPVDVAYATEIGLPIINTPYAKVQSVAEHAIAQMLAIAKRIRESDKAVRDGHFDYRYARKFHELCGKTLGMVGFGAIGRRTAQIARAAFNMQVLVYSPSVAPDVIAADGMQRVDTLDELLTDSDVISLHQRLNTRTSGLFNRERFARMKMGAILVNTGRGATVDTDALVWAAKVATWQGPPWMCSIGSRCRPITRSPRFREYS